ncbi:endonuclease domain-containing protein [Hymenobacter artigasi]|uniref:Very-short-patch-repair endonuclease n=1 Tax=Hymenobacter artigasi TaxID=2719616 RepID=A0ABX1HPZ6_9BACT|nr:endonuclease domain-containing protein [Hymenobacter artigasi]NKI91118.1 very-short-patch-repair endonuclease [Hymenobacter artigasi]
MRTKKQSQVAMDNYHNLSQKKDDRRTLRNILTPAEATLWKSLKGGQLAGRKFRRQHSVGAYILDFYCPEERIAVELDGAGHYTAAGNLHDAARTAYLNTLGIQVVRFENKLIWSALETVLQAIVSKFHTV